MGEQEQSVFIIEDDRNFRTLLASAFEEAGMGVETGIGGREVQEKIQNLSSPPDAFVLDVMLPHVSGVSFLEQIRELYGDPSSLPVIIVSSFSEKQIEGRIPEGLNYQTFIEKPCSPKEVVSTVQEFIEDV